MRDDLRARLEEVVWVDTCRLSGEPCFRGTRIPVQMLIDHLTAGFSPDEFLETVPSLEREQAQRFLGLAGPDECVNPKLRLAFSEDVVKKVPEMESRHRLRILADWTRRM